MSNLVGRTISHYEILEALGIGGMGTVYKARDIRLERIVALKFLPPELTRDPDAKRRFLHEARTSSSLQHKNICIVYDIDETDDGQMFISMECIEGETLKERIKNGPIEIQEAVKIASEVVRGLARAHEFGVVHRDLKPANVMLAHDGSVKVLDFGLAKSRSGALLTLPGTVLGTVAYMSPEQSCGDPVDKRTDVWSLGVMLFEMVAGGRPFANEYDQAVMYAVIHERHPSVRSVRPEIPSALEAIIDRCLAKSPDGRFPDAGLLLDALDRIGKEPNFLQAAPGRSIGHYEILEALGAGGMGTVYKARDIRLERIVALKFLPVELTRDPEAKRRFLLEARASSSLQHKNICVVYDIDETDDGQMFMSMECIDGETLQERITNGPLPIQDALRIASQVARGVAKAHESGVVHRDLKPANVMLAHDGSVKVLDFGLAKSRSGALLALPGTVLGTVAYMSPEQASGDSIDKRTDVWSLGVILYEMVTGSRPFANEYDQAVMYAVVHERHPSPQSVRPEIPRALEAIIDQCLEKSPDGRFPDAGSLLGALDRLNAESKDPQTFPAKSIAVLPFSDISPEKDNKYFSDGLTEEIIAKLSRLQKVRIVSQSSVIHYERAGKTTLQIAAELHVQYLLEGSVRKAGQSLRITTHLIDARQDAYLWTETYNGTMEEIFDIQEDVAGRIVKALKVRLSPDDRRTLKRRATVNTSAYQLYLKGRFFWSKRTKDGLLTAIRCFEEAIEKDERYAPAWAGIADAYLLLTDFVDTPRMETYAKAKAAVERALEIDDRLPEAHASLGLLSLLTGWDWSTAERELRLAIESGPNYATAHHWYAEWLSMRGMSKEAISEISRAVELDPLSPAALKDKGLIYYYAREYDHAIECATKALELDANFALAHRVLSLAYQAKGMHNEALAEHVLWTQKMNIGQEEMAALALCHAVAGRNEEAREILGRCPPRESAGGNLARAIAQVLATLGDVEIAFAWLDRAYEAKAEALGVMLVDPKWDPIRSDVRFTSLLKKVGLTK